MDSGFTAFVCLDDAQDAAPNQRHSKRLLVILQLQSRQGVQLHQVGPLKLANKTFYPVHL